MVSAATLKAQQLLARKLSGRRINLAIQSDAVKKEYTRLINEPETLRQLSNVNLAKQRARELGFGSNLQEFAAAQQQFGSKQFRTTEAEAELQMSLPPELRNLSPIEARRRLSIARREVSARQSFARREDIIEATEQQRQQTSSFAERERLSKGSPRTQGVLEIREIINPNNPDETIIAVVEPETEQFVRRASEEETRRYFQQRSLARGTFIGTEREKREVRRFGKILTPEERETLINSQRTTEKSSQISGILGAESQRFEADNLLQELAEQRVSREKFLINPVGILGFETEGVTGTQIRQGIRDISGPAARLIHFNPVDTLLFGRDTPSARVGATAFILRTGAEAIPENKIEAALLVGGGGLIAKSPKIIRIAAQTGIAASSFEALTGQKKPEEKVFTGAVGVLATTGAIFEATPYARGIISRLRLDYVKTGEVFREFPKGYSAVDFTPRIALIPEQSPRIKIQGLPKSSPLRQGAFGFPFGVKGEKTQFLKKGQPQTIATSQRTFFSEGEIIQARGKFYGSPEEPTLKIPETRISRLGIEKATAVPKSINLGFGFPEIAQIGIEKGARVTKSGKGTSYRLGVSTELEVYKESPVIKDVKQTGVTTFRGQAVQLFEFRTGKGKRVTTTKTISTSPSARVSGEGVISTALFSRTTPKSFFPKTTSQTIKTSAPTYLSSLSSKPKSSISTTTPQRIITPTKPSKSISPPSIIIPPSAPPTTPPKKPKSSPFVFRRYGFKSGVRIPQKSIGGYIASIRRYGKFKPVASGVSFEKAFQLGRYYTQYGLGQTFKVRRIGGGMPKNIKTPSGYYPKFERKEGLVFIEKPKSKINTPSEIKLLQTARKRSKRRKKK